MAETKKEGRVVAKKPGHVFADMDGNLLPFVRKWCEGTDKRWLDLLTHTHGQHPLDNGKTCTYFDPNLPIGNGLLRADEANPLCKQCTLNTMGCENPYISARGPDNPIITIVT